MKIVRRTRPASSHEDACRSRRRSDNPVTFPQVGAYEESAPILPRTLAALRLDEELGGHRDDRARGDGRERLRVPRERAPARAPRRLGLALFPVFHRRMQREPRLRRELDGQAIGELPVPARRDRTRRSPGARGIADARARERRRVGGPQRRALELRARPRIAARLIPRDIARNRSARILRARFRAHPRGARIARTSSCGAPTSSVWHHRRSHSS